VAEEIEMFLRVTVVLVSLAAVLSVGCDKQKTPPPPEAPTSSPAPSKPTSQPAPTEPTTSAAPTADTVFDMSLGSGFYAKNTPGYDKVFEIEELADRVMLYNNSSQFDIGPGRKKDRGQPVYLKADQLTEHLKSEKKKALAVVWLDKSIMESTDDVVQVRSGEAMLLLEEIGYRRGIVLGADPQGIHCLSDKIHEE
jgi:hypothetical protein